MKRCSFKLKLFFGAIMATFEDTRQHFNLTYRVNEHVTVRCNISNSRKRMLNAWIRLGVADRSSWRQHFRIVAYPDIFNLLLLLPSDYHLAPLATGKALLPKIVDFKLNLLPPLTRRNGIVSPDSRLTLEEKINLQITQIKHSSVELYLNFLDFVLPYFHDINKEMQSESPKLYLLYERIFTIYKTIMECFIKPDVLQLTEGEKNSSRDKTLDLEKKILSLDYENKINHLPIEKVYLGGKVQFLLLKPGFMARIRKIEIIQFKETCILFYMESLRQIRQRFCFEEKQRLKSLAFMNLQHLIEKHAVPSIAHIGVMFPGLFPETDNLTELDREWRLLRNMALPFTGKNADPTPEEFWKHVSLIKKGDQSPMFPLLCQFIRKLLALPHSSANVERLFSSINNMKTCQRNTLCTDTLESLLHIKSFITKNNGQPSNNHLNLFNKNMYKHKH